MEATSQSVASAPPKMSDNPYSSGGIYNVLTPAFLRKSQNSLTPYSDKSLTAGTFKDIRNAVSALTKPLYELSAFAGEKAP
jgi:hypothetical protein